MKLKQLRERRAAIAQSMGEMHKKYDGSTPENKWTGVQQKAWDEGTAELADLDAQIARETRVLDLEAENRVGTLGRDEQRQLNAPGNLDPRAIFQTWLRRGDSGISQEQWAVVRNTMSTTTPAEGGYTVPTTVATTILDTLKAYGTMRNRAQILRTAGGAPMNFPTSDGTSEIGEILAENATATDQDISFGILSLVVYKFSSKVVAVPIELLQDSSADIEGFVQARLRTRLGRATESFYATGTGTGQPHGILAATGGAGVGKIGATGQTATVTYDDLIDLIHSVDPIYRVSGSMAWMMHDSTLKVLRKLKDGQGRPIFVPGWDVNGLTATPAGDRLLGYPVEINQNMPEMGANAKSILFGDFNQYIIRDAMDMEMYRFTDSAYAKKGQVGFLAMMRTGGRLMDVGGAIKYYQNSAT